MKKITLLLLFFILSALTVTAQTNPNAIIGLWLSPKKDTKIEIYQRSGKFYGKIIWGSGTEIKDLKNPDKSLRDRDLVGLDILTDFVFDGKDTWQSGTIYDPREGKTYSCKMSLKGQNSLNIRGFVGISLFGRTEIWDRIK